MWRRWQRRRRRGAGGVGDGGGGMKSECSVGTGFQFGKMKSVLEMDDGDGYTTMRMNLTPPNCMFQNG